MVIVATLFGIGLLMTAMLVLMARKERRQFGDRAMVGLIAANDNAVRRATVRFRWPPRRRLPVPYREFQRRRTPPVARLSVLSLCVDDEDA